ncbi:MAG: Mut7-C RNAse domain-containing protein, partial [Bacteroidales bacterium]|nr:Mut7-C RNAse domain-containing protein [Bacteroidales bacterium]
RKTKFILDVHLGKLARYLRMLGFDTLYENNYPDPQIIDIAKKEKRIILTRDVGILKNSAVTHGYWVRSQNPREQLREVITRFDLSVNIKPLFRCMECNGIIEKVDKKEIIDQLKPKTKKYFNEFFRCTQCKKVYWEGSHYKKMINSIKASHI